MSSSEIIAKIESLFPNFELHRKLDGIDLWLEVSPVLIVPIGSSLQADSRVS